MTWDLFNVIGTIAFALSGVIVAMEEDYDIMGIYILGLVTAFGGGAVRNLLIGLPVTALWEQGTLFTIALIVMTFAFITPIWINKWLKWGMFFDAIGLAAFAIQGALFAKGMELPLSAIIVAAVLTGTGGGIIRDILAGRKPLVFRSDIYVLWAILGGLVIGLGIAATTWQLLLLAFAIVTLRMLSVQYRWQLPHRHVKEGNSAIQK
ncbi:MULTISPECIES: trimeric intracellular cation channel family protein [Alteribacter]|uniref:Trimeric intracellular cation channel family protein n=1 Tax=Alteribacter keqinensis TaxID=2483800 RepID=A0A3M7TU87_9BACI|nr:MULTISPECIES: trimeric intracellular cation channel family protein [Alteribacter]MBM7094601.1 trimeric intracellular cation channel family protein [Alteribacter salitolerans]RNA69190.1 trimeric intracellular cation channel family protein [Alteribacter keqinensis]